MNSAAAKRATPRRENRFDAVLATPFGKLGIRTDANVLTGISFLPDGVRPIEPTSRLAERACEQVGRYLRDPGFCFRLPMKPLGTVFQRRVWSAISAIAPGRTRSYGEIARELGSAPRAVGQACGENPFPLVVPCHRVVAAGGIGGFAHAGDGYLLRIKRWLLAHESADIPSRP